jgi:hypothetical protein
MLGKLMKYEFKATGRIYLPLFGALIIIAAISRVFMSLSFQVPQIIGISLSVFMMIAIFVIALIITIQRFYKNLLGSEGYLMFTLPVNTDQLIWSKLLVASIWNLASIAVVILAIAIMAMTGITMREIAEGLQDLLRVFAHRDVNFALIIGESVIFFTTALLSGILTLYACMAVSLLFNKHRGLISFAAYIVYYIAGQIIASVLVTIGYTVKFHETFMNFSPMNQIHFVLISGMLTTAVTGVVFYILTRFMLRRKLNLE